MCYGVVINKMTKNIFQFVKFILNKCIKDKDNKDIYFNLYIGTKDSFDFSFLKVPDVGTTNHKIFINPIIDTLIRGIEHNDNFILSIKNYITKVTIIEQPDKINWEFDIIPAYSKRINKLGVLLLSNVKEYGVFFIISDK